jgi:hypothetical protein
MPVAVSPVATAPAGKAPGLATQEASTLSTVRTEITTQTFLERNISFTSRSLPGSEHQDHLPNVLLEKDIKQLCRNCADLVQMIG